MARGEAGRLQVLTPSPQGSNGEGLTASQTLRRREARWGTRGCGGQRSLGEDSEQHRASPILRPRLLPGTGAQRCWKRSQEEGGQDRRPQEAAGWPETPPSGASAVLVAHGEERWRLSRGRASRPGCFSFCWNRQPSKPENLQPQPSQPQDLLSINEVPCSRRWRYPKGQDQTQRRETGGGKNLPQALSPELRRGSHTWNPPGRVKSWLRQSLCSLQQVTNPL